MNLLLGDAAARASRYLDGLRERRVAPSAQAVTALAGFDEPFPDSPARPEAVLDMLDRVGSPATVATAGPRFFGFVIGGALPITVAASWLATAWDQNAGLVAASPAAATLEEVALKWLLDIFGLPPGSAGAFVTGATVANFSALAAARTAVLAQCGWNADADGLFGAPPVTVIVGEEVHPSVTRALGLLGFGRKRVVAAPVDKQGRMCPEAMPRIDPPSIVCVQAGNVNTGAFDPIADLCALAHEHGAWVHVDGAFGMWAAASPALKPLLAGAADADSWATDAHKWLNVPYDSGLAFVREPERLHRAMSLVAAYLPQGVRREPSQYTPELSRRARGVEVWAALKSLGRSGLREVVERSCRHARRFAERLSAVGCTVLNDVVLNQVLVSFGDAAATQRAIQRIQQEGTCWCGPTVWQEQVAMRISVCSWATTDEDVERSIDAMLRCR